MFFSLNKSITREVFKAVLCPQAEQDNYIVFRYLKLRLQTGLNFCSYCSFFKTQFMVFLLEIM